MLISHENQLSSRDVLEVLQGVSFHKKNIIEALLIKTLSYNFSHLLYVLGWPATSGGPLAYEIH